MNSENHLNLPLYVLGALVLFLLGPAPVSSAAGGIATDGSMGAAQSFGGAYIVIPQSLGATAGRNLFHSFAEFNISNGQTVDFTGSRQLQNVIARVTGADASNIDGTLRSSIANAAFYFINPNGIVFGNTARINVPGAFHVSSADKIDFADNRAVYAALSQASSLSSAAPAAYGFLGTSARNNGLIAVNGAQLAVKAGQTQDMVAGRIAISNDAHLTAPTGEIRLLALQGENSASLTANGDGALPLPTVSPASGRAGSITVSAPMLSNPLLGTLDTSGNGGGRIGLWGGAVSFTNTTAYNDNNGDADAAAGRGVDIRAQSLVMDNSWLTADALNIGKAGNINVIANDYLAVKNLSIIKSDAFMRGDAGAVGIESSNIDILNGGYIATATDAQGQAGSVSVAAGRLNIDNQGNTDFATGIGSVANPDSSGSAGAVSVEAERLALLRGGQISSATFATGSAGNVTVTAGTVTLDSRGDAAQSTSIFSNTESGSSGRAGDVSVQAQRIDILEGGDISSTTDGQGDAGEIRIQAERLNILDGGQVSNSTFAAGNAGHVGVDARAMVIDSRGHTASATGIYARANPGSSGAAGRIDVDTATLAIFNGGNISSSTSAGGDAGAIQVVADALTINGQGAGAATGINSKANAGSGDAGYIGVRAGRLAIYNGGAIASSTFALGNAGVIEVTAAQLTIDSFGFSSAVTGIVSQANASDVNGAEFVTGDAGNLRIHAETLDILNGGNISTTTYTQGAAGTVQITADTLTVDSLGNASVATGIFSEAKPQSNGQAGRIDVRAASAIHLYRNGKISTANAGFALDPTANIAGNISVAAPDVDMQTGTISTRSSGNVAAGHIALDIAHGLTMQSSSIDTTAGTGGNGGDITIKPGCDLLYLEKSALTTSVNSGANSDGGSISIATDTLVMDTALVQANTSSGRAGDVGINVGALISNGDMLLIDQTFADWQRNATFDWREQFGFNLIQAASNAQLYGEFNIVAPQLNLSGILANLGSPRYNEALAGQDFCGSGTDSSLTRVGAGGVKPKGGKQLLY